MDPLYHITSIDEAQAARATGVYYPKGFEAEGFVHCSTRDQVLGTAQRFYAGAGDLVLFEIDPGLVGAEIRYENLEGGEELFPHLYGALPLAAVMRTVPFPCDAQGEFRFPD